MYLFGVSLCSKTMKCKTRWEMCRGANIALAIAQCVHIVVAVSKFNSLCLMVMVCRLKWVSPLL